MALDEHVIHVNLHVVADLVLKYLIDELLVDCPDVLQPERYDPISIQPPVDDEHYLLLVMWYHFDLVVPKEGIHKSQQLMS